MNQVYEINDCAREDKYWLRKPKLELNKKKSKLSKPKSYFSNFYLKLGPDSVKKYLADPGEARGCSINSLVIHSFIKSVILFLPELYGAARPKRLEIELPVTK